jgi:hypothetical protein
MVYANGIITSTMVSQAAGERGVSVVGVVGVAAVAVAVAGRGLRGLGHVRRLRLLRLRLRFLRLLLAGAFGARARAQRAAAAHQVLHLPLRRARPVGAGRLPVPSTRQQRSVITILSDK